jgi:hypothetical protein
LFSLFAISWHRASLADYIGLQSFHVSLPTISVFIGLGVLWPVTFCSYVPLIVLGKDSIVLIVLYLKTKQVRIQQSIRGQRRIQEVLKVLRDSRDI